MMPKANVELSAEDFKLVKNYRSDLIQVPKSIENKAEKAVIVTALGLIALLGLAATAMVVMNQLDVNVPFADDLEPITGYLADHNVAIGVGVGTAVFTGSAIGLGVYFFKPRTKPAEKVEDLANYHKVAIQIAMPDIKAEAEAAAAAVAVAAELVRIASEIGQL